MLAALGVIAGDILIHIFRYEFFMSLAWLFVSLTLLIFTIIFPRKIFLPLAMIAGIILISFRATPDFLAEKTLKDAVGHEITIAATVQKDPNVSEDKTTLVLTPAALSGKLFASLPKDPKTAEKIQRGDKLTLRGELKDGFGTYAGFLYRPEILNHEKGNDPFLKIRDTLAENVRKNLPEKEAGLALGYLLGIKSGVDKDFEQTLRIVGLTHIIVASGTHLSILASFARKIFGRATRLFGFLGAAALIGTFVGITGLTPSMSRAAPVALLSLLAWYLGRDRSPARTLLIVAAGTLLLDPANLLDLAWLLSFASFTGIMVISPLIKSLFYGASGTATSGGVATSTAKKPGYIAELVIASLSATFACAPILLYYFGSISLISIFANLLILPTISIVMALTLLTGVLNLVALTPLAGVSAVPLKILLDYHFAVVNFLGEQKFFLISLGGTGTTGAGTSVATSSTLTGTGSGTPLVFLLYVPLIALIAASLVIGRRRRRRSILTV